MILHSDVLVSHDAFIMLSEQLLADMKPQLDEGLLVVISKLLPL